jgi:DNA-directed RNA polymerase subunit RPC12/RpoP
VIAGGDEEGALVREKMSGIFSPITTQPNTEMAVTTYKCIKCGNQSTGSSHPLVGTCSKGGGHDWVVRDGGFKRYKCIKCGNQSTASSQPVVGKCSKGGGHDWVAQ